MCVFFENLRKRTIPVEFHVSQTRRKFHDQPMYTWIFSFVSQVRSLASNSQFLRSTEKLYASKVGFLFANEKLPSYENMKRGSSSFMTSRSKHRTISYRVLVSIGLRKTRKTERSFTIFISFANATSSPFGFSFYQDSQYGTFRYISSVEQLRYSPAFFIRRVTKEIHLWNDYPDQKACFKRVA